MFTSGAFRTASIRDKLRFIIIFTSGMVLLLPVAAFTLNDLFGFHRNMLKDLGILADLT